MKWFRKKGEPEAEHIYDGLQPAVKSSICTGETAAGFLDAGGRFQEVMLIEGEKDLELFCRKYHLKKEEIRHVY